MSTGVSTNDFSQILSDMGRTLAYKVVTKTTNGITGEEQTTYAAATNITAIFFLEQNRYLWDKEGLLQVGDAYLIAPLTLSVKRYDQFTVGGETFYIENTTTRTVLSTDMATYCTCFRVA